MERKNQEIDRLNGEKINKSAYNLAGFACSEDETKSFAVISYPCGQCKGMLTAWHNPLPMQLVFLVSSKAT